MRKNFLIFIGVSILLIALTSKLPAEFTESDLSDLLAIRLNPAITLTFGIDDRAEPFCIPGGFFIKYLEKPNQPGSPFPETTTNFLNTWVVFQIGEKGQILPREITIQIWTYFPEASKPIKVCRLWQIFYGDDGVKRIRFFIYALFQDNTLASPRDKEILLPPESEKGKKIIGKAEEILKEMLERVKENRNVRPFNRSL